MRKTGTPRPPSSRSSEGVLRDAAGGGTREYMRLGRSAHGLERVEARFVGQAFSPHRHDSYAIGLTLEGVQTFRYRGAQRQCLPGECHVLHPDELHDGGSGSAARRQLNRAQSAIMIIRALPTEIAARPQGGAQRGL